MPPQPLLPNPPDYPIQPLYLSTPKQPKHPLPTNLPDYLDQPQTPSSAHNIYLPILTNLQTKPPYATMTTPSPLPICVPHRPKPHIPKQPFSTHHNCSCQPPATDIITTPPYPGSRPYQPLPPLEHSYILSHTNHRVKPPYTGEQIQNYAHAFTADIHTLQRQNGNNALHINIKKPQTHHLLSSFSKTLKR